MSNLPSPITTTCNTCKFHGLCLPIGVSKEEVEKLNSIIDRSKPITKDSYVYKNEDSFNSIYAIKSGSVKTTVVSENGTEQITGFYLPGELLALDSIHSKKYHNNAVALESTSLCKIPYSHLEKIVNQVPSLRQQLLRIMSKELQYENQLVGLVINKSAEERLASFLSNLAKRFKDRGYSHKEFHLPMPRKDIANYLGLTIETVSRLFTRFQKNGYLIWFYRSRCYNINTRILY